MTKKRYTMAMIAIILSISSAFAFKPASSKTTATTYYWYAVKSGSSWNWQSTEPSGASCQSGSATCEISTSIPGTPMSGGFPASYTAVQGADKQSVLVVN